MAVIFSLRRLTSESDKLFGVLRPTSAILARPRAEGAPRLAGVRYSAARCVDGHLGQRISDQESPPTSWGSPTGLDNAEHTFTMYLPSGTTSLTRSIRWKASFTHS